MKDCFMGLCSSGGWLTFCSAIVSLSMLSLGFCRTVHSISVSSGRMVGFLDRSPCMNQMKCCSYSSFSTTVVMVSRTVLDRTRPAIDRSYRDSSTAGLEQHRK
jgi:hypothetical protein